jgi:hypothetical protein
VVAAALAGPAVAAAPTTLDLPKFFGKQIAQIKAKSSVPILLPTKLTFASRESKLYATGSGTKSGWDLELTLAANCGGANACFLSSFQGERGGKLPGKANVKLAGGDPALFKGLSCGASCSPDSFWFVHGGVLYSYQSKDLHNPKAVLTAAANAAIAAGPR